MSINTQYKTYKVRKKIKFIFKYLWTINNNNLTQNYRPISSKSKEKSNQNISSISKNILNYDKFLMILLVNVFSKKYLIHYYLYFIFSLKMSTPMHKTIFPISIKIKTYLFSNLFSFQDHVVLARELSYRDCLNFILIILSLV